MKTDLKILPYSSRGSYMVLSELKENYREFENQSGLYLRTVHGSVMNPLVARLDWNGETVCGEYQAELQGTRLALNKQGKNMELCFADPETILIRSQEKTEICLDFLTEDGPYDYLYLVEHEGRQLYMANLYKNNCKYLIWAQEGQAELDQKWEESSSLYSRLKISGEKGILMAIREIRTEWDQNCEEYDFDACADKVNQEFEAFLEKMPSVPEKYEETRYKAAFLNWSSIVEKYGTMPRDGMFMSKNWMTNVWSWDHCFNALSLSYGAPQMAWDQYMVMFDVMDQYGRLPDSINDEHIIWNYCKPPVHGWALRWMLENMTVSREKLEEAYRVLSKWTGWWINYRVDPKTGLFYYNHGNDSGWDNSTCFYRLPQVATPELQADMIIQMDVLQELAERLGMQADAEEWKKKSEAHLKLYLEKCFVDDMPVSIQTADGAIVENNSLLPFISLVLGTKLPEKIREKMIREVRSDRFYTAHGFATESPKSPLYRSDGYWRGPIWAPSTLMLLDGLARCGETELVREASVKFSDMVSASGFAENFDALTGAGLRDRAYTWTASAFLVIAHEYIGGK